MPEAVSSTNCYPLKKAASGSQYMRESAPSQKIRVLVVDDYEVFREGLVALLKGSNEIEVVSQSADTRNGIQIIDQIHPDVVLVDISMPGTSPFELVKRAKVLSPATKVLYSIRDITDSNIERGLEAGGLGFVSKAESFSGIIEAIKRAHDGNKYFSSDIKSRVIAKHSYDPNYNSFTPRRSLLSPREIEVLCCVARGMKAKNIGKTLHITAKTVERHKSNIMAKLGLHSQVDLAIYAIKEGYITP